MNAQCRRPPKQNGVAERQSLTLVETVLSMLIDSKLMHRFGPKHSTQPLCLRIQSQVDRMTPFEAWTNVKPTVKHLRVFGCDAFVHIPKDERYKLDSKSKKCILFGYGEETKGYRQEKRKYSRAVMLNSMRTKKHHMKMLIQTRPILWN